MEDFRQEVKGCGVVGGDQSEVYGGCCLEFDFEQLLGDVRTSAGVAGIGEIEDVADGPGESGSALSFLVEAGVREALASECEELLVEVRYWEEFAEINGERAT